MGDILEIRPVGITVADSIFDQIAETFFGYNELLMDVALKPEMVHRLMGFLRDHALSSIDQVEQMGVLTENNDGHKYNSYSIKTDKSTPVGHKDLWIWSNSQIFGAVGPEQFNEFLLEYQKPVFERFGAVSYGCCEDLTRKIAYICTIPNLRTFVCSPWTDLKVIAPVCAVNDLCIEWRQLASDMMGTPDFEQWEKHLRRGLKLSENQRRYIVLQEVETIEGNINKFKQWCELAVRLSEEAVGA